MYNYSQIAGLWGHRIKSLGFVLKKPGMCDTPIAGDTGANRSPQDETEPQKVTQSYVSRRALFPLAA